MVNFIFFNVEWHACGNSRWVVGRARGCVNFEGVVGGISWEVGVSDVCGCVGETKGG